VSRRSGLGRGLDALIPQGVATGDQLAGLRNIPLSEIRPNQFQPRKSFDEEALSSLVDSIKAVGILQPILVRETEEGHYELIAGERRFRAARRAGLATIPALVKGVDDAASLEQALVENIHRENLNPLDEAAAYQQLIEDFGLTHDRVGQRVGKSRAAVTNSLRLFQLPPTVQRFVRDGLLSAGHARALLGTPDRALQERLAVESVEGGWSVRTIEDRVRERAPVEEIQDEVDGSLTVDGVVSPEAGAEYPSGISDPSVIGPAHGQEGQRPAALRPPGVLDLEELLGDHLSTRVRIDMAGKLGRVVIDFATLDDLERIYRVIIGRDGGLSADPAEHEVANSQPGSTVDLQPDPYR
jgi:ParB family chromosome partitioning protein